MGLLKKLRNKDEKKKKVEVTASGNTITVEGVGSIVFQSPVVGTPTGSNKEDFYVYEWFIEETGEVFYIGKGRGDRYKEYHEHAYDAEKIRKLYKTGVRFIAQGLTEDQALEIETAEMVRILNETDFCLANLITPYFTARGGGYTKSRKTPAFQYETAPVLYATEADEHYFDIHARPFDEVDYSNLTKPHIITKGLGIDEIQTVYGGDYERYYKEVVELLEANGNTLVKSKYAKSVTAWIYPGEDLVTNNDIDENKAVERIGRRIPCYHLIDVWKVLKKNYSDVEIPVEMPIEIHPVNERCPISEIKNLNDWEAGFDAGFEYWEKGDAERKKGNIEAAIILFDKARANGDYSPALYKSYAMAYRKIKDLDNEISILDEGIERYRKENRDSSQIIIDFENQKSKAVEKLKKRK